MPIYEFYCPECHTVFNFFSRSVNTAKTPICPGCGKDILQRQVSLFAMSQSKKKEGEQQDDLPIDESRMEQALYAMAQDAEGLDEDNPKQAADLMRKFSKITGLQYGPHMEEAHHRLEAGEDPESIEEDMGDLLEGEEPFLAEQDTGKAGVKATLKRRPPKREDRGTRARSS